MRQQKKIIWERGRQEAHLYGTPGQEVPTLWCEDVGHRLGKQIYLHRLLGNAQIFVHSMSAERHLSSPPQDGRGFPLIRACKSELHSARILLSLIPQYQPLAIPLRRPES